MAGSQWRHRTNNHFHFHSIFFVHVHSIFAYDLIFAFKLTLLHGYVPVEGRICELDLSCKKKEKNKYAEEESKKSNQKWIFGSIRMHRMVYARVAPQWTELKYNDGKMLLLNANKKKGRERMRNKNSPNNSNNILFNEFFCAWIPNKMEKRTSISAWSFFLSFPIFCRFACLANRPKYYYMHHKKGIFFFFVHPKRKRANKI